MSGYPDYQTYPSWQGDPVVSEYAASFNTGPNNFGPFPAGPYAGLLIVARDMPGSHRLEITWSTDEAGTNQTYSDLWDLQGSQALVQFVPAGGPWYTVQLQNNSGAAQNGTLVIMPVNGPPNGAAQAGAPWNFPLIQASQSVPAGTDLTIVPAAIYTGPATLSVHSGVANFWTVTISVWDASLSAWDVWMTLSGTDYGSGTVQRISLPRKAVQVDMHNGSTSARTLTVSLTAG